MRSLWLLLCCAVWAALFCASSGAPYYFPPRSQVRRCPTGQRLDFRGQCRKLFLVSKPNFVPGLSDTKT